MIKIIKYLNIVFVKLIDKYFFILLLLLLSLTFFLQAYKSIDPDFGWHYRMGELILKSGIPKTDPFSYTMPSYRFIDHEWLVNLFMFKTFGVFGQLGLSLFYLLIMIFIWFLIYKSSKDYFKDKDDKYWQYGILLLSFLIFLSFFGIRPQVLSWLFISFLLILLKDNIFNKFGFIFPFLMFVWANLHGSFATGIVVYFIYFLFKFIRGRKVSGKTIIIFVFGVLATFINPYVLGLWKEVYMSISDSYLRWRIMEWMPSFTFFHLPYLFFLSLSLCLIWKYKNKIKIEFLALYIFFLIQSLLSIRHVPLWMVITLPLISECFLLFKNEIIKIKEGKKRYLLAGKLFFGFIVLIFVYQISITLYSKIKEQSLNFYPVKSVEFLQKQKIDGEIFSQYGWGGYLIWKLPEKKVFIDGRMPSWRRKNAPESESKNAMSDYELIFTKKGEFEKQFKKYNVKYVLLPPPDITKTSLLGEFIKKFVREKKQFNFIESLQKEGWKEIYKDNTAVVYSY